MTKQSVTRSNDVPMRIADMLARLLTELLMISIIGGLVFFMNWAGTHVIGLTGIDHHVNKALKYGEFITFSTQALLLLNFFVRFVLDLVKTFRLRVKRAGREL